MSKGQEKIELPEISGVSRDHSYRHSLQPQGSIGPNLRHTQSQNYGKKKKKVKVPPIPESDAAAVHGSLEVVNEQVKVGEKEKKQRHSKTSQRSGQSRTGVDNAAFEIEDGVMRISRGNSAASSVRSSMRDPSVQNLTVVHEQYCCCSKWTPCERTLFAIVGVLAFIIIILVIVVAVIASGGKNETKSLFSVFSKI